MNSKMQMIQREKTCPVSIDYLPEEYRRKAEKELNETAENSSRCLKELKFMAKYENTTQGINFNEDFLRQFLRQSKYDVQRSLKRLAAFVRFRSNNSKYFKGLDCELLSKVPDYKYCTTLPWRCHEGCTIIIYEMSKWDPRNLPVDDLLRLSIMMFQQSLRNPMAQINGFKMIVDYKGSSLRQLKCMSPQVMYASYQAILECTPARNKEIHMVNESMVMKGFWTLFKPFLSNKLRNRFLFHASPKDLLNYFPKHALPEQYGGDLKNYYMGDWLKEASEQQSLATHCGQNNYF